MTHAYRVISSNFGMDPDGAKLEEQLNEAAAEGYRVVAAVHTAQSACALILERNGGRGGSRAASG